MRRDTIFSGVKITISKENYLKAIAEAESEGETVIAATLARWLNVSAPAVTKALNRLKRDGLAEVKPDGIVILTPAGRDIATRILNRHHLIERMLTEVFGMEWFKVHDEAERLEHAVSADFEKLLVQKLGSGGACPHGNQTETDTPLLRRERGWSTLDEVRGPEEVEVVSVFERDRQLLEFLNHLDIHPGARLQVVARNYDETITFRRRGADGQERESQLGVGVARKVWVTAAVPAAAGV